MGLSPKPAAHGRGTHLSLIDESSPQEQLLTVITFASLHGQTSLHLHLNLSGTGVSPPTAQIQSEGFPGQGKGKTAPGVMALLHAAPSAGCCLVGPLDPSHNPEECHQLCAMKKTWKGEARELAQGHVAGRAGGQGSEPGWARQEEAEGSAPGKEEGWQHGWGLEEPG